MVEIGKLIVGVIPVVKFDRPLVLKQLKPMTYITDRKNVMSYKHFIKKA